MMTALAAMALSATLQMANLEIRGLVVHPLFPLRTQPLIRLILTPMR